jgi:hypothetical protein
VKAAKITLPQVIDAIMADPKEFSRRLSARAARRILKERTHHIFAFDSLHVASAFARITLGVYLVRSRFRFERDDSGNNAHSEVRAIFEPNAKCAVAIRNAPGWLPPEAGEFEDRKKGRARCRR